MAERYRIGKTLFGTLEAKETWIIEGVLRNIEYVLETSDKKLGITERELLKLSKRKLTSLVKARRKRERSGKP